jgi:CDP-diacylglycerol--glycerol-3-phosphate 3-phosphatidyltransferase
VTAPSRPIARKRFGQNAVATPANFVTLTRILVAIPTLALIRHDGSSWATVGLWFAITSTDSLDGWLARRDGATRSGAFLDPVADKLMVAVTLFLLVESHPEGWSSIVMAVTAAVIVGREISISALREWMAEVGMRATVKVAFIGKLKTVMQIVALVVLIVQHEKEATALRLYHIGEALLVIAGVLTIWSGLYYLHAAWPTLRGDAQRHPGTHGDA